MDPSRIPNKNLNIPTANRQPAGLKLRQLYTSGTFSSNTSNSVKVGYSQIFFSYLNRVLIVFSQYS